MKNKIICSIHLCSCFSLQAPLHTCKDLTCCMDTKYKKRNYFLPKSPYIDCSATSNHLYEVQFIPGNIFPKFKADYTPKDSTKALLELTPTIWTLKLFGKIYRSFQMMQHNVSFSLHGNTTLFDQNMHNNFTLSAHFDTKF